jgi:hypothetical protein
MGGVFVRLVATKHHRVTTGQFGDSLIGILPNAELGGPKTMDVTEAA